MSGVGWLRVSAACGASLALVACSGGGGSGSGGQSSATAQGSVVVIPRPSSTPTPTPGSAPGLPPIDVVLVMGQSNATGFQVDRTTDYRPGNSVIAWDGVNLIQYAPNLRTGLEGNVPAGYWAAELSYIGHYRATYPQNRLVVLRFTAGGTRLQETAGESDWSTRSSGELLDQARAYVRSAFATLRLYGFEPRFRLIWWQQGENDVGAGAAYGGNLAAFVAALRDPAGDFAVPSATPIAIGRLSSFLTTAPGAAGAALVRDGQTAVAHADMGGPQVLLDDDDLPLESDGIHLSRSDQLALGDRLWAIDQGSYVEP